MNVQDIALAFAGVIGSVTAVIHAIVMQRHMVSPIDALISADGRMQKGIRNLSPVLFHLSSYCWLLGGLALIGVSVSPSQDVRLVIGIGVGALYLYGAIGNAWATRGRHPGWMLMTAALSCIFIGLCT